jgi:hypothetical protein
MLYTLEKRFQKTDPNLVALENNVCVPPDSSRSSLREFTPSAVPLKQTSQYSACGIVRSICPFCERPVVRSHSLCRPQRPCQDPSRNRRTRCILNTESGCHLFQPILTLFHSVLCGDFVCWAPFALVWRLGVLVSIWSFVETWCIGLHRRFLLFAHGDTLLLSLDLYHVVVLTESTCRSSETV